MYDPDELRSQWEKATHELPYGVQRVFKDVLDLVQEGKKNDLVYGADYSEQGACLVNASANMLVSGGGHGIPMAAFGDVVSLFDKINKFLENQGVNNQPGLVSPFAAEILLNWYAPLKDVPPPVEKDSYALYVEPTDKEMEDAFMELLNNRPVETPFDEVIPADEYAHKE